MAFGDQTRRLLEELRRALVDITDEQARDLVAAWVDAWNEVEPDLRDALLEVLVAGETISRAQMLRSERLQKVLGVIRRKLEALAKDVGVRVIADLERVIDMAGSAQASIIDSQLPPGAEQLIDLDAWSRVDQRQIDAIVRRTTKQITSRTQPLSDDAYAAVRGELVRAIASGSNPKATAKRMVARAEREFNGGLSRALTIARTETIDAYRDAAAAGEEQHEDVLAGWIWLANLRPGICPACLGMNGTVHELDEPGPMGHQNCRCARVPKVKPWSELGFDLEEPRSEIPDADEFFAGLTKEQQVDILGRRGWEAWNLGQWPRESWAERRSTDGWRDSYGTAKAPQPKGEGGALIVPSSKGPVPGAWTGAGAPAPGQVTRAKGVRVLPHERITSYRLASLGENVHWLPNPNDDKSADAVVKRLVWEIKAPEGNTDRTIRNNLERAHQQGDRAIIDLYRTPLSGDIRAVLDAIDAYWGDRTASGGRRVETIWVLTENVRDHFTLEYGTWLSQR